MTYKKIMKIANVNVIVRKDKHTNRTTFRRIIRNTKVVEMLTKLISSECEI
jgi:hypothetical protein